MKRKIIWKLRRYFSATKKPMLVIGLLFLITFLSKIFIFSVSEKEYTDYFNSSYKVFGITIPKDLNFAGEKVPIKDFSVREGLDKEFLNNTYWQSQTLLIHKRAHRWLPTIESILKKHGIPDDFKYIAIIESNLTNSVSKRQAAGFWQILESTAKAYGLEVNEEVDERYHLYKATEAACKYFKEAHQRFGNWTLVAASYNLGMAGIENQMEKQKTRNFYNLNLNEETTRYLFRILAMKEIISKPKKYGYILRKKDLYPFIPTYSLKIDSTVTNLPRLAILEGVNYKTLMYFNPWLQKDYLNNKEKKTYYLLIPKAKNLSVLYEDEDKNSIQDSEHISDSELNQIPYLLENDSILLKTTHAVKEKETLTSIALHYHVDENKLRMWNSIAKEEEVKPKQEIIIYTRQQ